MITTFPPPSPPPQFSEPVGYYRAEDFAKVKCDQQNGDLRMLLLTVLWICSLSPMGFPYSSWYYDVYTDRQWCTNTCAYPDVGFSSAIQFGGQGICVHVCVTRKDRQTDRGRCDKNPQILPCIIPRIHCVMCLSLPT